MEPTKTSELQKISIPRKIFGYDIMFVDSFIHRAKKEIEYLKEEIKKEQEKVVPLEQLLQKKEAHFKEILEQKTAEFQCLQSELETSQKENHGSVTENLLLSDLKEKLAKHEQREDYIKEALIAAQKMATELKQKVRQEADELLEEAKLKAEQIIKEAEHEVEKMKWVLENLKIQKSQQVQKWRKVLKQQLDLLENIDQKDPQEIYPNVSIIDSIAG